MKDTFNPEQKRRLMELAGIPVDEMKLDTPELIRKYAGIPGSSEEHTGYNTPGTNPEFIWKNLPNMLETNYSVTWLDFQSICKNGLGGVKTRSAVDHKLPGGFWFTPSSSGRYSPEWTTSNEGFEVPGELFLKFIFNKNVLDPKKTYWDGENGGDETDLEDGYIWDTDELEEFWYNGSLPVEKCKIVITLPVESRGTVVSPNISKAEFEALAFPKNAKES